MIELMTAALFSFQEPNMRSQDKRLDWWRDERFGMFIHWGLYAVPAGEWADKGTGHAEWIRTTAQIPLETYDEFIHEFNPVKFDANEWCAMAKDAGMGYVVITSKHHDGFCLFESEHTDFDIMNTPFKRDIMKELAEAAPKHDVKMCWYHSIMDWHHPDYLPRRGWEEDRSSEGADMDRFREYLHAQVTELLTNYGPIGIMWFDGEWESTWRGEYGKKLYELCREVQPEVIVNNRLGARGGMAGLTGMDGYAGGYAGDYATPEQEIPDAVEKGLDWETCMTMNDRWGYNAVDKNFKSTTDLLQKLSDIVSKNGNFLLNVGPKADGTFPDESIQRLSEIGDWMDVNGEAIKGTIGSPFKDLGWGRATQKFNGDDTTLYLHVFDWPEDGTLEVSGLSGNITSARVLGVDGSAEVKQNEGEVVVQVPSEKPNEHIGVVAVEFKGKPVVYEEPTISSHPNQFVHDATVNMSVGSPDIEIRYAIINNRNTSELIVPDQRYTEPIVVDESCTVISQSYFDGKPVSKAASLKLEKVTPKQATQVSLVIEGTLKMSVYSGDWDEMPNFDTMKADAVEYVGAISPKPEAELQGRLFEGYIKVDKDDMYIFTLTSDDGSNLYVHDELIIDNDGLHGPQQMNGSIALSKGWHPIRAEWFNKTGGATLNLRVGTLGGELYDVDASMIAR